MDDHLYYQPPSGKAFNDMRAQAIKLWKTYDNTHGYVDEKVDRIRDLENVGDNFMYIYAMFDYINQHKLHSVLKQGTLAELLLRLGD